MNNLKPYDSLAKCYSELMNHVDYVKWAKYIQKIIVDECSTSPQSVLELAAGNLSFAESLKLPQNCYRVHTDLSFSMLSSVDSPFDLSQVDMRSIPFKSDQFDVVFALYDSVNYLLSLEHRRQFFQESLRVLKSGGLLIFDAVSPYTCFKYFSEYKDWIPMGEKDLLLRSAYFDEDESIQYNDFFQYLAAGKNTQILKESHVQKILELEEWLNEIADTSFQLKSVYADYSFRPARDRSERWHFVLQKI